MNKQIEELHKIRKALEERLLFESLLSEVSARFVNTAPDRLDEEIEKALKTVMDVFQVDRCGLLKSLPGKNSWLITHVAVSERIPPVPSGIELPRSSFPWAYKHLIAGHVLSFSTPEATPTEAEIDRESWRAWGIRSNISIPILTGESVDHVINIHSVENERDWPEEFIPRLRLLGEVFVNALERRNTELALRKSEDRLNLALVSADASLWDLDLSTDIIWLTEKTRDVEGLAPGKELAFSRFVSSVHPEDRGLVREFVEKARSGERFSVEYRMAVTPGNFRWINSMGRLSVDPSGNECRLMGVSIDITERKVMEAQVLAHIEEIERLKQRLETENIYLRDEIKTELGFGKIIGHSDTLQYVLFRAQQVAPTDATVLLLGETGTGKGIIANTIHDLSPRKDKPMITVNCAALPSNLIESELFGREKGAFTGAYARQIGRFEVADDGTIFLDEIGELPLELQAKLLRVLQDGEFERLGSTKTIKVDVRVIASTSRNLKAEMREGRFREDLYYRLNTFPITLPPLRMRVEDIPELIMYFIDKYAKKYGRRFETFKKDPIQDLQAYSWPGNVRELEHVVERAVITSPEPVFQILDRLEQEPPEVEERSHQGLEAIIREHMLQVLQETGWRIDGKRGAAAILGLNPSTLRFRLKKMGLKRP